MGAEGKEKKYFTSFLPMLLSQQVRKMGEYKLTSLFFCKILKKNGMDGTNSLRKEREKVKKGKSNLD